MMTNYKNYTDEELFNLWKEINEDIKRSQEELSYVGLELAERKYILTEEEYNAIDYALTESKLYDSGFYIQQDEFGRDYFVDEEDDGKTYSIKGGLKVVLDAIIDYEDEYPTDVVNSLKRVFKKYLGE